MPYSIHGGITFKHLSIMPPCKCTDVKHAGTIVYSIDSTAKLQDN